MLSGAVIRGVEHTEGAVVVLVLDDVNVVVNLQRVGGVQVTKQLKPWFFGFGPQPTLRLLFADGGGVDFTQKAVEDEADHGASSAEAMKDPRVTPRSWNEVRSASTLAASASTHGVSSTATGGFPRFSLIRPDRTDDSAQLLAAEGVVLEGGKAAARLEAPR